MKGTLFDTEAVSRDARISECGRYRYTLSRTWSHSEVVRPTIINFIMLNPSVANAEIDDPTIRRCIGYAKGWSYGGLVVTNLYAFRATDPKDLWAARHHERVGPDNDRTLIEAATLADLVICAWGVHGTRDGRGSAVRRMLRDAGVTTYRLALTGKGEPAHPLYLPAILTASILDEPKG
jgi:hypothetical protein